LADDGLLTGDGLLLAHGLLLNRRRRWNGPRRFGGGGRCNGSGLVGFPHCAQDVFLFCPFKDWRNFAKTKASGSNREKVKVRSAASTSGGESVYCGGTCPSGSVPLHGALGLF